MLNWISGALGAPGTWYLKGSSRQRPQAEEELLLAEEYYFWGVLTRRQSRIQAGSGGRAV